MHNAIRIRVLLATALVSGAAAATPITDTESLVLDVKFWGRELILSPDPTDPINDIVTYGIPVHGTFRIWTEDAPPPKLTSAFLDTAEAVVYGRDSRPVGNQSPISFVTSRWLSPFPTGFVDNVSPFPGAIANDHLTLGNGVRFPKQPRGDWFQVTDAFSENFDDNNHSNFTEQLFISVTTPLDIIQDVGLEQEFDLSMPAETSRPGYGFFMARVEGVTKFFDFVVERLSVSSKVCRR